jgi:hypothetical protein
VWSAPTILPAGQALYFQPVLRPSCDLLSLADGRIVVGAGHLIVLNSDVSAGGSVAQPPPATPGGVVSKPRQPAVQPKVRPLDEQGVPVRWIEAERIPKERGKAAYRGETGQQVTIEQLALEHYRRLGYAGGWTENDYWWAIMALLFWDVIFARLPGVFTPQFGAFPGPMQDMPQDFFTPEFFERRKALIEKRIAELTETRLFGLKRPSLEAELTAAYGRHRGQPCRAIDWARFPKVDDLLLAPKVMRGEQLVKLMRRLLVDFGQNRSGLPDLFLAKGSQALLVEVKSERERIADHQWVWLHWLRDEVGVPVEICRVFSLTEAGSDD